MGKRGRPLLFERLQAGLEDVFRHERGEIELRETRVGITSSTPGITLLSNASCMQVVTRPGSYCSDVRLPRVVSLYFISRRSPSDIALTRFRGVLCERIQGKILLPEHT